MSWAVCYAAAGENAFDEDGLEHALIVTRIVTMRTGVRFKRIDFFFFVNTLDRAKNTLGPIGAIREVPKGHCRYLRVRPYPPGLPAVS